MTIELYPVRGSEPEGWIHTTLITGTAGTVTKVSGKGVTVTYIATGVYQLTFADYPGSFGGVSGDFQATTMSALKGYTAVLGSFDATGKIVQVSVFNSSFAAADLIVSQWLSLGLEFKRAQTTL